MTVAGLATAFLKEHLGWRRAAAIAAGFAGVVIAVNPLALLQDSGAWLPYVAVFGNMIGMAIQMFLLRALGHKESNECISFYPRVVIVSVGIVACATHGFVAMSPFQFLSLCAVGVLGSLSWVLMAQAYKNAPAAIVAPVQYAQMIIGAALGYLIWGDVPTIFLWSGAAVIIGSGIYLVRHERRMSRMMIRME
jgi:drug/metabolite transporter (DMT)-like permease